MFQLAENRQETGRELRDCVVETLQELMKDDNKITALEADLGGASGFTKIKKTNPDRFIQCGIAEANMMGVAAGLYIEKKYIDSWIQSGRDALLIMGARQIGKTYLIKECLRESVVPYVELK